MSTINVDNIAEYTSGNGVEIPGHILQVVNATDTTVASYTSTAGQGQKLGSLQLTITPKSTSSKIFLMTSLMISGQNRYWEMNFYRDSTRLGDTDTATGSRRNIFHQAGIGDFTDIISVSYTHLTLPTILLV